MAKKIVTCNECKGECCKKLAFIIDPPKNIIDYEDIKWYLYHKDTIVYIDNEGDWMVQVPIKCTKLDKNNKCTIYKNRPPICRMSKMEECEKNMNEMDIVFKTVKNLESHMKKNLNKNRK